MRVHEFIYRKYFSSFVDFAFRELHPDELFFDNWHIQFMADLLQFSLSRTEGAPRRIAFNLPANSSKTHVCSVSFPAWVLGRDPRKTVLILSETPELAWQLQERCAELMGSARFQAIFSRARIKKVGRSVELKYGGGIRHAGVSYSSQHKKSDIVILDNPQSLHSLERFNPESFIEIGRLLRNPKEGLIVLATRRLGDGDLTEFLCRRQGWQSFGIPGVALEELEIEFPPNVHHKTTIGEPLNEMVESWEDIERQFRELGAEDFCHQILQSKYSPRLVGGAVVSDYIGGYPVPHFVRPDPEGEVSGLLEELKAAYFGQEATQRLEF